MNISSKLKSGNFERKRTAIYESHCYFSPISKIFFTVVDAGLLLYVTILENPSSARNSTEQHGTGIQREEFLQTDQNQHESLFGQTELLLGNWKCTSPEDGRTAATQKEIFQPLQLNISSAVGRIISFSGSRKKKGLAMHEFLSQNKTHRHCNGKSFPSALSSITLSSMKMVYISRTHDTFGLIIVGTRTRNNRGDFFRHIVEALLHRVHRSLHDNYFSWIYQSASRTGVRAILPTILGWRMIVNKGCYKHWRADHGYAQLDNDSECKHITQHAA